MKTPYCICIFYYADLFVKEHKNTTNTLYLSEQVSTNIHPLFDPFSPESGSKSGSESGLIAIETGIVETMIVENLTKDPSTYFKEKSEGSSSFSSSSSSSDSSDLFFSAEDLLLLGEKSGVDIQILNSTQDGPYSRLSHGFIDFLVCVTTRGVPSTNRKCRYSNRKLKPKKVKII